MRIKHGDIFQFYSREVNRYFYFKLIATKHINKDFAYPWLIRVSSFYSTAPINNIEELDFKALLISPALITGWTMLHQLQMLTYLGKGTVEDFELFIPDYRLEWPPDLPVDWKEVKKWKIYVAGELTQTYTEDSATCGHLQRAGGNGIVNIFYRIEVEYCKINSIDVNSVFDKTQLGFIENYEVEWSTYMPIYKDIPEDIKDKYLGSLKA